MGSWAEDPELVATFRAEVEERLASLTAGLLELEGHASPRQLVASLFRDAHTVKGSARMLGLDGVLQVAHSAEDLLGALRDGRLTARRDIVDVLLVACDGILRSLPGHPDPVTVDGLAPLVAAMEAAVRGEDPVVVPQLPSAHVLDAEPDDEPERRGRSGSSVRVAAAKVYDLIDVVGEATLGASRVQQTAGALLTLVAEYERASKHLRAATGAADLPGGVADQLHRLLALGDQVHAAGSELRDFVESQLGRIARVRDGAMSLAMVPVDRITAALPRLVRDVAASTGKDVHLEVQGEDVELDKKVLDGIADAVKHLVINAVDHGCETPDERVAAGKPPAATVSVVARAAGGTVVLEVSDDGAGVDEDAVRRVAVASGLLPYDSTLSGPALLSLLFTPALSTSSEVTETSGRGVGLDVVQRSVEDLGGSIEVRSERGIGSSFVLTLPMTLGVLRCLVARVGDERYAVPVAGVVESVGLRDVGMHEIAGSTVIMRHGVSLPLVDLGVALGAAGERKPRAAVIVRNSSTGEQLAWAVDALEGESELVVKDLGPFLGRLPMVTGATIDGTGAVVCLVDLRELAVRATASAVSTALPAARDRDPARGAGVRKPRVLLVEDSVGVRELERVILEGAGYEVVACVDGLEGAARLREDPVDVVLSDVEMPGMDGFTLTRRIRRTRGWEQVPVVIMTSRGDEADRRAGMEAGASAYLLKSDFDQAELVDTVRRLVGR